MKIIGKIVKGKGKGKRLGFPTINVEIDDKDFGSGVYAGLVQAGEKNYKAGIFIGKDKKILEAYVIGFSGDLYGKEIEIEIIRKIRDVIEFESDKDLKKQIKKDIEIICSQE